MISILLVSTIIAIIMTSACVKNNSSQLVEMVADGGSIQNDDTMFIRHRLEDGYSILEEHSTGVCYLEYNYNAGGGSIYGITCMINPDGTAKVWERWLYAKYKFDFYRWRN